MSADAAGSALFDAIGRRNAQLFPGQLPHEAGEILVRALARRGYRLVYDPVLAVEGSTRYAMQEGNPPPVRDTREHMKPRPMPPDVVTEYGKRVYVNGRAVECSCGYDVFDVLTSGLFRCCSCEQKYQGRA